MQVINSVSARTWVRLLVEQAYVTFKPAKAKGFELDFGKFVTSAGAEVIESYSTGTIRGRCCFLGRFLTTTSACEHRGRWGRSGCRVPGCERLE